jgi:3-oxoacyl-[acyl-carrier protein] reductase
MGILDERANLTGKTAVVMGGADGMGRGITVALAKAGVDLAFCDINTGGIEGTLEQMRGLPRNIFSQHVDVCDATALDAFWDAIDQKFPRIDIVVNVVGGVKYKAFLDSTPDTWAGDLRRNLGYVIQSCHHAGRRMRDRGHPGSIINITTIEGYRAAPGYSVYTAAKGGVVNFTKTLGTELGPLGIRVNCIAPDETPTPGLWSSGTPEYDPFPPGLSEAEQWKLVEDQGANAIPLGRLGRIEDIENCVLFLGSDLGSYITGQTLHCDGGAVASAGWYNFPRLGFRNRVPFALIHQPEYWPDKT